MVLGGLLLRVWAARLPYPFDLEWMEGGVLAHAWRLARGLPLYVEPGPDFVPFVYPPGYSAIVAFAGTFGLAPWVGRLVSLVGTGLSAGALVHAIRERGGGWVVAIGVAATWLGTYPVAGAFFDLVRPDALGVAALAWAVALSLRPRPGAAVAAGLLVALATLVKHNLGLVGLPLLVGFAVRDARQGLGFAAAAAGPVGLIGAMVQLRSDGRFLRYLLEVPASHQMVWSRAIHETPWELAKGLAVPLVLIAFVALFAALRGRGRLPRWLVAGLPVWTGVIVGWTLTYAPVPPWAGVGALSVGGTVAAVVSIPISLGLLALGRSGPVQGERVLLGAVVAVLSAGSVLMRVHDGGFSNVQMPMFWAWTLLFGVVLVDLERTPARTVGRAALALGLILAIRRLPVAALSPTDDDVARGQQLVEQLRDVPGPVLSPFASWLPTYAGHAPSLHTQAVWDVSYPGGPFGVDAVRVAIEDRYWGAVVGGNYPLIQGLPFADRYAPGPLVVGPAEGPLRPKTGFAAMPIRVLRAE